MLLKERTVNYKIQRTRPSNTPTEPNYAPVSTMRSVVGESSAWMFSLTKRMLSGVEGSCWGRGASRPKMRL